MSAYVSLQLLPAYSCVSAPLVHLPAPPSSTTLLSLADFLRVHDVHRGVRLRPHPRGAAGDLRLREHEGRRAPAVM
jgi:hypothetical protein